MFSLSQYAPSKRASEIELLLFCVRGISDPDKILPVQQPAEENFDWHYLLEIAIQNRVMPVFYMNLTKMCPQKVPRTVMHQLQEDFIVNAAHSYLFADRLIHILRVFEDNDIIAIPFKGPVLAENIYGDIALRQFGDLDILVSPHSAFDAHELLKGLGYRPQLNLNGRQLKTYINNEYSCTYVIDKTRFVIELHWNLLGRHSSFSLDLNTIHTDCSSTLNKNQIRSFSSEDLLLYQCLHSSKDTWKLLENICCIAKIINLYKEINWKIVESRARKMRCERILLMGLFLAFDLFEPTLPVSLKGRLGNDPVLKKMAWTIYDNIFDKSSETKTTIGSDFSFFHMKMRDRILERVHYGVAIVFNPSREEWRILPLPAPLSFLHYLFRPIRLAAGIGKSFIKTSIKRIAVN